MNRFFTLFLAASGLNAVGQVEVTIPYNPDENANAFVETGDLLELLGLYGQEFFAQSILIDGVDIQIWTDSVQSKILTLETVIDSLGDQNANGVGNACADEESIHYHSHDYQLVAIGEQCWFAENLRTELYLNGDSISNSVLRWMGSDALGPFPNEGNCGVYGEMVDSVFVCTLNGIEGSYAVGSIMFGSTGACEGEQTNLVVSPCNPIESLANYGRLYNFYSVRDSRKLCPENWHVSTDEDWLELELFLGMPPLVALEVGERGEQGIFLKSTNGWGAFSDGYNSVGFNALPGGARNLSSQSFDDCAEGTFRDLNDGSAGEFGGWWSPHFTSPLGRGLNRGFPKIERGLTAETGGLSVRCVKD